jgi:hypothetical protein
VGFSPHGNTGNQAKEQSSVRNSALARNPASVPKVFEQTENKKGWLVDQIGK